MRKPIAQCASLTLEPCLTVAGLKIAAPIPITEARYSFYTPELQLLAETAYSTEPAKAIEYEYIWFGGQPLAQIETAMDTLQYYFTDHIGTPILTTDANGNVDWRIEREPYGKIYSVRVGADLHRPLSFPGQEDDRTNELSYNVFRWYMAGWGRYTQSDPIGLRGGINTYGYASTNPLIRTDPLGLAYFAKRKLQGQPWIPYASCNTIDDKKNTEFSHEQLFFEDGKNPSNLGFFADNKVKGEDVSSSTWHCKTGKYNDCVMRKAAASVTPKQYCAIGKPGSVDQYNCQNWADDVRKTYSKLISDAAVQKECGCGMK